MSESDESPEKLPCPECSKSLDPRGFRQHVTEKHGWKSTRAKTAFDRAKNRATGDSTSSGWVPPSQQTEESGDGDGGDDTPPPLPSTSDDEPEHVKADSDIQRLEKKIARREREARLNRLEKMLDDDDDGSDPLEMLKELREAGLIPDADDGEDGRGRHESQLIVSELRSLRQSLSNGAGAVAGGESSSLFEAALASGADGDTLETLASEAPRVKMKELELEKEERRAERRREMIDNVMEKLDDQDLVPTLLNAAVGAIVGGGEGDGDGGDVVVRDDRVGAPERAEEPEGAPYRSADPHQGGRPQEPQQERERAESAENRSQIQRNYEALQEQQRARADDAEGGRVGEIRDTGPPEGADGDADGDDEESEG